LFLYNFPSNNASGQPGVRFDIPMLFDYSIALAVGVLVVLRGPHWGVFAAFLAGLGIVLGIQIVTATERAVTPALGWWFVGFAAVVSVAVIARGVQATKEFGEFSDPEQGLWAIRLGSLSLVGWAIRLSVAWTARRA